MNFQHVKAFPRPSPGSSPIPAFSGHGFWAFLSVFFILIWLLIAAFPFAWTLWGSFKVEGDFFSKVDWRNALSGLQTRWQTGGSTTADAYRGIWLENDFWQAAINTFIVSGSVVLISLIVGTLAGYALSRCNSRLVIVLLILVLLFRAVPHITLVSGYLMPFFHWNLWGQLAPAVLVLVALNQPLTIWLMYAFFRKVPTQLDDSAMLDGCTRFQAFRYVVMPLMWPGVLTAGLFSFLLAYNDFTVTSLLLSQQNRTVVPQIASMLGSSFEAGNVMFAVAAAVSVTAPVFVLIVLFHRQLVSGLTAGAVKG